MFFTVGALGFGAYSLFGNPRTSNRKVPESSPGAELTRLV